MKITTPSSVTHRCQILLAAVAFAAIALAPNAKAQQPAGPSLPPRATPPKIVLKLDDLVGMHPNWQKVVDSLNKRNIKAGFGIICNSLEHPSAQYVQWLKDTQAGGHVEFWCHGYDHKNWTENGLSMWEFYGPPVAQQKQHLEKCQQLAKQVLGAPFNSFGAPFNQTDEKFAEVMRDEPGFKVWMYGDGQFPMGKTVLTRVGDVNIENPIFRPSTERLAQGMAKHPTQPYFVIQGHPPQWDAPRLAEFEKMLDFLTAQKAVFMTPTELAATLPPPGPAGSLPPPSKQVKAPASANAAATPAVATQAAAGVPVGDNLLPNGDFANDLESWKLDRLSGATADVKIEDVGNGNHAAHVTVPQAAEKRFYVQLTSKAQFPLVEGKTYTLSFRARALPEASAVVVISPGHGPWEALARQDNIKIGQDWADHSYTVTPAHGIDAASITFSGLAGTAAEYWFTDMALKENQ